MDAVIEAHRHLDTLRVGRAAFLVLGLAALGAGLGLVQAMSRLSGAMTVARQLAPSGVVSLPAPRHTSNVSLEAALLERRSVRAYRAGPLRLDDISQLLWAAQGISDPATGARTAPSAGALYPLELSIAIALAEGIEPGLYRYRPDQHALSAIAYGDVRPLLAAAALGQASISEAAAILLIAGVYERVTGTYGDRGIRYSHLEAGHAAQNVYLQATALDVGTVVVGAFDDDAVRRVAGLANDERPLYLMPIGRR